eukprot:TRINITY_DN2091_c0_g8_i1.p3 TRINITY_DN2091_c0_g8~~TRINITY_DN2091_c0_g8_i1.p3  ORF type:complete len:101 (-),score=5.53 TRINITY_DN2091_c0_g8_i1:30-332(-)
MKVNAAAVSAVWLPRLRLLTHAHTCVELPRQGIPVTRVTGGMAMVLPNTFHVAAAVRAPASPCTGNGFRISAPVLCVDTCLLYTSPSPRDRTRSRMPSSA